jgi:hypothetical protein
MRKSHSVKKSASLKESFGAVKKLFGVKRGSSPGKVTAPQLSPRAISASTLQAAANASSPPPAPNILLFGYWPPTGTDFMLKDYLNGKLYRGYFVQAFSPTFGSPPAPVGWLPGSPTNQLVPVWSYGSGSPKVDYQDTATFFWNTVPGKNPVAIMSFSRSGLGTNWYLEADVYNYGQSVWDTAGLPYLPLPTPTYPPPRGSGTAGGTQQTLPNLAVPFAGGSSNDPSPYKNKGTITNNPPDRTKTALTYPPSAVSRTSALPNTQIIAAINALGINVQPSTNTDYSILGNYVSAYMAYLVCWYGSDSGVQPTNAAIKKYGHTHVSLDIPPSDAQAAFKAQLDALIDALGPP